MAKNNSSIYGTDDNAMAGRIASDALGSPSSGNPIDQSAFSKGNIPDDADVKIVHSKTDSRTKSKGNS